MKPNGDGSGRIVKRFTPIEDALLTANWHLGTHSERVAEIVGHSEGVVRQRVLRLGLRRTPGIYRALRDAPPHLIQQRYDDALSDGAFIEAVEQWRKQFIIDSRADAKSVHERKMAEIAADESKPRHEKMRAMRELGATLDEIGKHFGGISRERVRQLTLSDYNGPRSGGRPKMTNAERQQRYRDKLAARLPREGNIKTILRMFNRLHPNNQRAFLDAIGATRATPADGWLVGAADTR